MNRPVRIACVLCVSAGVVDQALQYSTLRDGYFLGRRIAPFDPPFFTHDQEQRYERYVELARDPERARAESDFDADLGWVSRAAPHDTTYRFDTRGCRIGGAAVPSERSAGVRRAAAFGCSFTFGQEVQSAETWVARVDEARPDLEVLNFGAGAYGLDQALLRYRRDGVRESLDEVWLGVLPTAVLRNVSTYHPAYRHWNAVLLFKPRFELGEGDELVLVENPARSLAEEVRLLGSQAEFVRAVGEHDQFVAKHPTAYAPFGSSLWHRSALARLTMTWFESRGRDPRPYLLDDQSEAFRVELRIVEEFAREARANGARFRVVILPSQGDLQDARSLGRPAWEGLCDAWRASGIEVFDAGVALLAAGADEDPQMWAPGGHYSAAGNALVADALGRHLAEDP